jgi:hypothetical protein
MEPRGERGCFGFLLCTVRTGTGVCSVDKAKGDQAGLVDYLMLEP